MACDTVIDSVETTNRNHFFNIDAIGEYSGQAFTLGSTTRDVCKASFFLNFEELDAGEYYTVRAEVRACSGTVGTNAVPTGAALATSDNVTITNGDTGWDSWTLYNFDFSTPYTLTASTDYCILLYIVAENCAPNDDLEFGAEYQGAHAGNYFENGSYNANYDAIFYIYYDADVVATGWTGIVNGVTNPEKVNGVSVANIVKVNGVS